MSVIFALVMLFLKQSKALNCWATNEETGKFCRALNTETYEVKTQNCEIQKCSGNQVCARKTTMRPGSKGNGGYELADVVLLGCRNSDFGLGCEDVELSEDEMCFCDSDFCNGARQPSHNLFSIILILPLVICFL